MVGTEFIDYVSKFQLAGYAGVEDFADKINFIFTVIIISVCTLVVTVKQYILKPISCYIATEVGGTNLLNYVENYCWVQGTLPISYSGKMPSTDSAWQEMEAKKILYYQWVPFVLGLQCILFYVPRLVWQLICHHSTGSDLEHIIKKAVEAVHAKENDRPGVMDELATWVEHLVFQEQKRAIMKTAASAVFSQRKEYDKAYDSTRMGSSHLLRRFSVPLFSRPRGNYIFFAYLSLKLLYLANAVAQMFLMQAFLGFEPTTLPFGVQVLENIFKGQDWQVTLTFPRVGFCLVKMKQLGVTTNAVTAQCALPVNMLNEKIYIFLWWWILLAAVLTVFSLLSWLLRFCCTSREANYVLKYINLADDLPPYDERDASDFALRFLRRDGMFLMRMIRINAGDVVTAAIVNRLWQRYLSRTQQGLRDPMTNVIRPNLAWTAGLEPGGKTDDSTMRVGHDDWDGKLGKERLFVGTEPSAPMAGEKTIPRTVV
ncbi:hypothetical protein AAHC03_010056 [Spirometra sp. Aus1]